MTRVHEVVVSGVGGVFPESDDLEELVHNLMIGMNMVTTNNCRWVRGELGVPCALGKIRNPDEFDVTLFGIPRKLAEITDPNTRLSIAQAFRAVCDAGINPAEINGSNTAVLMSSFMSETEDEYLTQNADLGTYGILANSRTMQANRISFFLNLKGPSNVFDATWCGGTQALLCAYDMISTGMADAAIVGASSLSFRPQVSVHYQAMGRLSTDGSTRSFSSDAAGYARSEACVTLFLQRAQDARRSYGTILGAFTSHHGMRDASFLDFGSKDFKHFLKNVYSELSLSPKDVCYYEAIGTASKNLDAKELNTVADVFLPGRERPLMIGSVKSNLGHTEGASSLVSLVKALIALDRGVIPPNLNYRSPNEDVPALVSGDLQVVTEPTDLRGDIVAVNDIGLSGGTMSHVVIQRNSKAKPPLHEGVLPPYILPRLVLLSDRNEINLKKNLKRLENMSVDDEYATLINCLNKQGVKGHLARAYTVWNGSKNDYNQVVRCSATKKSERRPVCFVFSGMGSQWPAMGRSLLRLPVFAKTIEKCHAILLKKGINLMEILTSYDLHVFESILNCFVGIAAVQIALTDVLRTINVVPDVLIGHSVGELGCGYADGCLTMEQTLLSAWARGKASTDAELIKGTMAAIGLGYADIRSRLPPSIDVACHNSASSCTLSGPALDMERFVAELKGEGHFAKLVNVANIAYHSRYIKAAGPLLLNYLRPVIPEPKPRSPKWLSTSVPEDKWGTDLAKNCSAEYYTNNLLSPVLFEEAARLIPSDAMMIEIAPHGLIQAILRRSHSKAVHIPLTSRFDEDNLMFLLSSIGKIYANGLSVDVEKLYPPAKFPVSRGTPPLSHFYGWQNTENFKLEVNLRNDRTVRWKDVTVDLKREKHACLVDQKMKGRIFLPKSFVVQKVVKHFLKIKNQSDAKIEFQGMKFKSEAEFVGNTFDINVQLQQGTGSFCVVNGSDGAIISDGIILMDDLKTLPTISTLLTHEEQFVIEGRDVVDFMDSYGLSLKNTYANVKKISFDKNGLEAIVNWEGRFVEFLNGLFSLIVIFKTKLSNTLETINEIDRLTMDLSIMRNWKNDGIKVQYDLITNILQCEGVQIFHPETSAIQCRLECLPFESYKFIPYSAGEIDSISAVDICLQLINENTISFETVEKAIVCLGKNKFSEELIRIAKTNCRIQLVNTSEKILEQETHSIRGKIVFLVADNISIQALKLVSSVASKTFALHPETDKFVQHVSEIFSFFVSAEKYILNVVDFTKIPTATDFVSILDGFAKLEAKLVETNTKNKKFGLSDSVCLFGEVATQSEVMETIELAEKLSNSHLLRFLFTNMRIDELELKGIGETKVRTNVLWNGVRGSIRVVSNFAHSQGNCEPENIVFGVCNELSGVVVDARFNDRIAGYANSDVIGIGTYDSLEKSFKPDEKFQWRKPTNWTPTEAMSVPLLFSMAAYIIDINNAESEGSILINRGFLPLSQAVISLLEHSNIEIYVTVYGEEKNEVLKRFPFLKKDNIFDCSSSSFYVHVLKKTGGRGVYKVVNTFEDDKMIKPCVRCVGELGVYVQATSGPMIRKFKMGMSVFMREVLAVGVTAENMINLPNESKIRLRDIVERHISAGTVRPLLVDKSSKYSHNRLTNQANFFYNSAQETYMIIDERGSISNIWLETMSWLLENGARTVIAILKNPSMNKAGELRFQSLRGKFRSKNLMILTDETLFEHGSTKNLSHTLESMRPKGIIFLSKNEKPNLINSIGVELDNLDFNCTFICMGRGGEAVCERSHARGLQSLCIRMKNCQDDMRVTLEGLSSLLSKSVENPVIKIKKKYNNFEPTKDVSVSFLPNTVSELHCILSASTDKPKFLEIPSKSPRRQFSREVQPIYVFPGFRLERMRQIAQKLFHPTFEARVPLNGSSVEEFAREFSHQILASRQNMVTLVAEGSGGILALHVATRLEKVGKIVRLVLVDSRPFEIVEEATKIMNDLDSVFSKYFDKAGLNIDHLKTVAGWFDSGKEKLSNDAEKTLKSLQVLIFKLQRIVSSPLPIFKLVRPIYSLNSVTNVHSSFEKINVFCEEQAIIKIFPPEHEDDSVIRIASEINTLALHEVQDAAYPPIEDFLRSNFIKANSRTFVTS